MVLGMAFLIGSDAASKLLVERHPIGQVMCLRQLAALVFVVPFVWYVGGIASLRPVNVPGQILRGLIFVVSGILIVLSLKLLPLPTVTAITFTGPIMIALLSAPMLRERVSRVLWLATLLGFGGVLLIIRPGTDQFSWALLVPVAAAFASSVRDIMSRILARTDTSIGILFWSSVVLCAVSALSAPFGWTAVDTYSAMLFLIAGAVNFCAHFLLIESYRLARAAVVAPFKYTSLLWSALLGYFIWGDVPSHWIWFGAVVLVASGLWIARTQRG